MNNDSFCNSSRVLKRIQTYYTRQTNIQKLKHYISVRVNLSNKISLTVDNVNFFTSDKCLYFFKILFIVFATFIVLLWYIFCHNLYVLDADGNA